MSRHHKSLRSCECPPRPALWAGRSLLAQLAFVGPVAVLALLAGCGAPAPSIKIDGSSTVYPISEAVAEEFCRGGARVNVTVGKSGTGGGMKKFYAGEIDICDASRPMKPAEREKCEAAGLEFVELSVAFDGIAIVVHPENDWCRELTVEQLASIWRPDEPVNRWNEINPDWPDAEIKLYGPGTDSGTFDYFTEEIVGKSRSCRADFTASEDDNVLVTGISKDKNSLGYFGFAYFEENADKLGVVAIRPDAESDPVLPSLETIRADDYRPLSRPLLVYVGLPVLRRPIGAEFAAYYLEKASELAAEVGYVPVSDDVAEENNERLARALNAIVSPKTDDDPEVSAGPKVGAGPEASVDGSAVAEDGAGATRLSDRPSENS